MKTCQMSRYSAEQTLVALGLTPAEAAAAVALHVGAASQTVAFDEDLLKSAIAEVRLSGRLQQGGRRP